MSQQSINGEILLDETEFKIIKDINTVSEMSAGQYCIPESRRPYDDTIQCCNGLLLNEESGLCETRNVNGLFSYSKRD